MPPKKKDNQSNFSQRSSEQNQTSTDMEIEDLNEESRVNKEKEKIDFVPDLTDIEKEEIEDNNNYKYIPEKFAKCFECKNELGEEMANITLKFILAKKKFISRNIKTYGPQEVYIINRAWYEKWKKFSRYSTMKRIIKDSKIYESRPISYSPTKEQIPGIINNEELLIKNKIDDPTRNILVSKNNECLDSKLDYKKDFKVLTRERFDLLNNYFHCDKILKAKKIESIDTKNYDIYSVHIRLIFLPTLALFKEITEENIEISKKIKI